jgi:hypothetical protein
MSLPARPAEGCVRVRLPVALITLFPVADRVLDVPAGSVRQIVAELDRRWPGMAECLCDSSPAIRRHINVFLDGHRIKLDTDVPAGSDLHILTAISGG